LVVPWRRDGQFPGGDGQQFFDGHAECGLDVGCAFSDLAADCTNDAVAEIVHGRIGDHFADG